MYQSERRAQTKEKRCSDNLSFSSSSSEDEYDSGPKLKKRKRIKKVRTIVIVPYLQALLIIFSYELFYIFDNSFEEF